LPALSFNFQSTALEHISEFCIPCLAFGELTVMASHADSAHDLLNLPISNLRQYVELFPNEGLSKVVTGYLSSGISRHPLRDKPKDSPDLSEGGVALNIDDPLTQEDCLVLMTVSIHDEHDNSYVLIETRKVYKRRNSLH
jgi:hypothetical protein